ncbi:hypothetical protein LEP1GSC043_2104 [Leptospira weilii str. Ecochallenge]|uniref:N-acetylmuramoyl-L-alanine amidase domain protein n=1 Tax=Leptospira weilii str. Ecochallenge TaxID=1049986 RepID=N1U4N5_9LEPT|nr:hypothetical protein LEP1GSC043_2104 [Leptospira weilii str. Ecochallenge]
MGRFQYLLSILFLHVLLSGSFLLAGPEDRGTSNSKTAHPLSPLKTFKVVIDPGHGGLDLKPKEDHGDKYDPISGKYLELYKAGASFKERKERTIVLELAKELKEVLDLTKTEEGFKTFRSYMKSFTNDNIPWIQIDSVMTRNENAEEREFSSSEDPNAPYRLFDYPDKKTKKSNKEEFRLSIRRNRTWLFPFISIQVIRNIRAGWRRCLRLLTELSIY